MKSHTHSTQTDTTPIVGNREKIPFFKPAENNFQPFFGPTAIQPKLKIGDPDDKYEQQADRVADAVVNSPVPALQKKSMEEEEIQMKTESPVLQMKCDGCEEEERLQMKGESHQISGFASPEITRKVQNPGSGARLPQEISSEMSHKMGTDFSDVNIHTGSDAAKMNQSLGARAFTHGHDIYFNSGEYNPASPEGKRLLAHELTHVVQQGASKSDIVQKTGEPGTSEFEEEVVNEPDEIRPGVWEGQVRRSEFIPATDDEPEREIHWSRVGLVYDRNSCEVRIPYTVSFVHPSESNWDTCEEFQNNGEPRPVPDQMEENDFNRLKERYVSVLNERLNGWYSVRINDCDNSCSGQDISIRVQVREDDNNPDSTVILANARGRSCVTGSRVVLYAGNGISDHTLAHEGGHMVLGHGDEYRERNPDLNRPVERVREDDWSLMANQHAFGRWALLHQRHFDFVREFVQSISPNCEVELNELSRPEFAFEFNGILGYSSYEGGGYYIDLGIDLEFLPGRSRDFQLFIGAHAQVLMPLTQMERTAFLMGARFGLEHTFGASTGGLQLGAFGEFGYGTFGRENPEGRSQRYGAPYFQAGGNIGYSFSPESGTLPFIGASGGYGSTLGQQAIGQQNSEWFFFGLNAGIQW